MDVPLLGSITLDWAFNIVGEGAGVPASNRIFGEFALTKINIAGDATSGGSDPAGTAGFGFQLRSNGTNYTIDPGGFNANEGGAAVDTGIAVGGAIGLSAKYTENSATSTTMEVFINGSGTAIYTQTLATAQVTGADVYAWYNTSSGTGLSPLGEVQFSSLGITIVPEPSIALLGGLGLLGLLRRRR